MAFEVKKGVGVVGMVSSRSHPVLPADGGMVIVVERGDAIVGATSLAACAEGVYMVEGLCCCQMRWYIAKVLLSYLKWQKA